MSATLTPEEIEAGFVRPLRSRVMHSCGAVSAMRVHQARDMANDPTSWSTCWCMVCGRRLPANQFNWYPDGGAVGS